MSHPATAHPILIAAAFGLLAVPPSAAGAEAEAFGRLFHTPAQRTALEHEMPPAAPVVPPEPVFTPSPPPVPLRIDGILRRSDGHHALWLNGELRPLPVELRLAAGRQRALVPVAAPQRQLQVGDSWPTSDGLIRQRPASAHRPAAADAP